MKPNPKIKYEKFWGIFSIDETTFIEKLKTFNKCGF